MSDFVYEGRDLEVLADMPNYYAWIMDVLAPYVRGHVVEYGSGTGTFTQRLLQYATSLVAVEPSANLLGPLRARFSAQNDVEICSEMLESHAKRQPPGSTDTVVMINVLEHVEQDQQALCMLVEMLKPGGCLLVFVPALEALMSKLDLMHGHYRRYAKHELVSKVNQAGAEIVLCRYFDLLGTLPWFVLNTVMGTTSFNATLVRLNDRIVMPISRQLERIIAPPFGKNLILVARKPLHDAVNLSHK